MPQSRPLARWTQVLSFGVLVLAIFLLVRGPDQARIDRQVAAEKIRLLSGSMFELLQDEIQKGGPEGAIEVCRTQAPVYTEIHSSGDFSIRRIGNRVRNHKTNVPTDREREILSQFAELTGEHKKTAIHEEACGDGWAIYKPIWIGSPICLQCHGPSEQLSEGVRKALATHYPDDEAVGYQLGDLRGAFVVERTP